MPSKSATVPATTTHPGGPVCGVGPVPAAMSPVPDEPRPDPEPLRGSSVEGVEGVAVVGAVDVGVLVDDPVDAVLAVVLVSPEAEVPVDPEPSDVVEVDRAEPSDEPSESS